MDAHTVFSYKFNELNKNAQEKAINAYIRFEVEIMDRASPYYYLSEEMEKMQTPWFLVEVIYEKHKEEIIETIKINNYNFYKDGSFF